MMIGPRHTSWVGVLRHLRQGVLKSKRSDCAASSPMVCRRTRRGVPALAADLAVVIMVVPSDTFTAFRLSVRRQGPTVIAGFLQIIISSLFPRRLFGTLYCRGEMSQKCVVGRGASGRPGTEFPCTDWSRHAAIGAECPLGHRVRNRNIVGRVSRTKSPTGYRCGSHASTDLDSLAQVWFFRVFRPAIFTDIRPPWEGCDLTNIRLQLFGQSPPLPSRARCGDSRSR